MAEALHKMASWFGKLLNVLYGNRSRLMRDEMIQQYYEQIRYIILSIIVNENGRWDHEFDLELARLNDILVKINGEGEESNVEEESFGYLPWDEHPDGKFSDSELENQFGRFVTKSHVEDWFTI